MGRCASHSPSCTHFGTCMAWMRGSGGKIEFHDPPGQGRMTRPSPSCKYCGEAVEPGDDWCGKCSAPTAARPAPTPDRPAPVGFIQMVENLARTDRISLTEAMTWLAEERPEVHAEYLRSLDRLNELKDDLRRRANAAETERMMAGQHAGVRFGGPDSTGYGYDGIACKSSAQKRESPGGYVYYARLR